MNELKNKLTKFENSTNHVIDFLHLMSGKNNQVVVPEKESLYEEVIKSSVPYNATIISLYGNIELFIDEVSDIYIDRIYKIAASYEELPSKMREKHENNVGEFLINPNRYLNYNTSKEEVIKNLYTCFEDPDKAVLNKKMLLRHSGNLNGDQVYSFYGGLGIQNFKNKILLNSNLISWYAEKKELSEDKAEEILKNMIGDDNKRKTILGELDNLVEQRNQVAHSGNVDEKMSFDHIENETIPFLICFAKTITEVLIEEIVRFAYSLDKIEKFTEIYEVYNNNLVLANRGNNLLKVGDIIWCEHSNEFDNVEVLSIKSGGRDVDQITISDSQDVSFRVKGKVKKNWIFFKLQAT